MDLFRVLQKANLTTYYDTFVSNGGDDIHQLLEASEEELNEILHVVGMDNKPLHIIRLKKALSDCKTSPDKFISTDDQHSTQLNLTEASLSPITAIPNMIFTVNDPLRGYGNVSAFQPANMTISALPATPASISLPANNLLTVGQVLAQQQSQPQQQAQQHQTQTASDWSTSGSTSQTPAPMSSTINNVVNTPGRGIPVNMLNNASLTGEEKRMIESAAEDLVKSIPEYPIKDASPSRKKEAGLYEVIKMSADNSSRPAAIYRYSAIYGRFNKARKTGKPMNHHEVAVNEAASQLCLRMPSLLSRREDLYPLARQVVKIAEESWKGTHRSRSHKKKKPNPSVVAIANEFASLHQANPQAGYVRVQEKIEGVKGQLCEIITQQDKLRMLFRAAKNGAAGPTMADIQKQIDHLSGIQQLRIAELGRYVLELRKFRGELSGSQNANGTRTSTSGVDATINALSSVNPSVSSSAGVSLVTNTLTELQHQQPQFLADVMNQQQLLSLTPSAPNVFTVFPSTLSAAGTVQQIKTENSANATHATVGSGAAGTATFFLSNNPMAALNAVTNTGALLPNNASLQAPALGTYTVNNASSGGVTQFPSFSVFTSFGQLKAVQTGPGTVVSDGGNTGVGGMMTVQGMKIETAPTVVTAGNVAGQYSLIRNS